MWSNTVWKQNIIKIKIWMKINHLCQKAVVIRVTPKWSTFCVLSGDIPYKFGFKQLSSQPCLCNINSGKRQPLILPQQWLHSQQYWSTFFVLSDDIHIACTTSWKEIGDEDRGKRKQARSKKGKQPVQAAMESSGSSSKSECEVRSWLQTVRQFPARFWADSRSESETSDSGILCVLCSAREPQTWMLRSGWTVETVVTGFIPPVHLVTIAAHASMFVWTVCSVSFNGFCTLFLPTVSFFQCCKIYKYNLFVSGDNGEILCIIASLYSSNLNHSIAWRVGPCCRYRRNCKQQGCDFP